MSQNTCFVCSNPAKTEELSDTNQIKINCRICGEYLMSESGYDDYHKKDNFYILSGKIREISTHKKFTLLIKDIPNLISNAYLPKNPLESIEKIITILSHNIHNFADGFTLNSKYDYPLIYAKDEKEFSFLLSKTEELGLIEKTIVPHEPSEMKVNVSNIEYQYKLTIAGWSKAEEISNKDTISPKLVFIAMQFGDPMQNKIYNLHMKKAVEETGFELKRLDELLTAGLIDNQMRVQIRRAKFLLADLTNENRGAYWEAGYAEGLGKPVIYLCKKSDFEKMQTHFDTNHHTTIQWDETEIETAMRELKATIRATFPTEAVLTD